MNLRERNILIVGILIVVVCFTSAKIDSSNFRDISGAAVDDTSCMNNENYCIQNGIGLCCNSYRYTNYYGCNSESEWFKCFCGPKSISGYIDPQNVGCNGKYTCSLSAGYNCVECDSNDDCSEKPGYYPGKAYCDLDNFACVECLNNYNCIGDEICDPLDYTCVDCNDENPCSVGYCYDRRCIECLDDGDCEGDYCYEDKCVECLYDSHCGDDYCEGNDAVTYSCINGKCESSVEVCSDFCVNGICSGCAENSDCDDGNPYTIDTCEDGICENELIPGYMCDDTDGNDYYTFGITTASVSEWEEGREDVCTVNTLLYVLDEWKYVQVETESCLQGGACYVREHSCNADNTPLANHYVCHCGCDNGACAEFEGSVPTCTLVGTKSEGWYDEDGRIKFANCKGCFAIHNSVDGVEGWYSSCDHSLIISHLCEAECIVNEDCADGYGCVDGTCLEVGCRADSDCPDIYYSDRYCLEDDVYQTVHDFTCVNSVCMEDVGSGRIETCEEGYGCLDGNCVQVCSDDSDCPNDYSEDYCLGNDVYSTAHDFSCVDLRCREDVGSGFIETCDYACVDGQCVAEVECEVDDDCDPGYECIAGECIEEAECEVDDDCSNDYYGILYCYNNDVYHTFYDFSCANQNCIMSTAEELVESCGDNICVNGICEVEIECDTDNDCDTGYICVDSECIEEECVDDSDCDPGFECDGGLCVLEETECVEDGDCLVGYVCVDDECVEEPECEINDDCDEGYECVSGACEIIFEPEDEPPPSSGGGSSGGYLKETCDFLHNYWSCEYYPNEPDFSDLCTYDLCEVCPKDNTGERIMCCEFDFSRNVCMNKKEEIESYRCDYTECIDDKRTKTCTCLVEDCGGLPGFIESEEQDCVSIAALSEGDEFKIAIPFYKSPLFKILLTLAIFGGIGGVAYYLIRRRLGVLEKSKKKLSFMTTKPSIS